LYINHVVNFGNSGTPSNEYDLKIYNWIKESKIQLPKTAIHSFYVRYFSGDFVHIRYSFNPEFSGIPADTANVWSQSAWHKNSISASPERLRFVENVKKWNLALVASSDQSLRDNKPQTIGLPALPGMNN
jgi:hypothetical protein